MRKTRHLPFAGFTKVRSHSPAVLTLLGCTLSCLPACAWGGTTDAASTHTAASANATVTTPFAPGAAQVRLPLEGGGFAYGGDAAYEKANTEQILVAAQRRWRGYRRPSTVTVQTTWLPSTTVGATYSTAIAASGGTAPYTCSLSSGALNPGLALAGCSITGKPTTAGTSAFRITATDSRGISGLSGSLGIAVAAAPTAARLSVSAPPAGTVGQQYTGTIGVAGGKAPYTCAITSGTLPSGLGISNCTISGTPKTVGSSSLSVRASDANSPAGTGTATIAVAVTAAPASAAKLIITSPAAATASSSYYGSIGVSGGTAPYTCTVASGSLPAGLSLNGCNLTGTPTTAGTYTPSIKATDSASPANSTTSAISMTVNPAASTGSTVYPHINYTDLNVGSGTGGDNGNGVYVRVFGSHFGASQGSSTVALGGLLVTNCSLCSWSDTQIVAQLGSSATTGDIVVKVNGLASNGSSFTVTPTTIVFVAPNGSDSNSGTSSSPFKTWRAAFNSVTSNDSKSPSQNTVIYLKPGTDVSFNDGRGYSAAMSTDIGGSSPTSQLSIVGYPGGTVTVGSTSVTNGVKGWGKNITIANLTIVGQVSAVAAEAGNVRIINNSMSCPAPPTGVGGTACVLGETTNPAETWAFHGNNVHDTGGNVDKTYHAVYFSSNVNHADIGWNNVGQNFKGYCRGIMFHATTGANQFDLHIHDNVITNSYCDGLGLASVDPSKGTVEVYNNVIAHTALASNPYGVANEAGIAINSDPAGTTSGTVNVYNNTVVDAGAYTTGNQNGCFGVVFAGAALRLTNNICSQPSPSQPYIEKGSANVSGSNNLWFGAGPAPSWDTAPSSSDPQFVSGTNFSLQAQSPAKNVGKTSPASPIDIIGNPRGYTPSMGAFQ